MLHIIIMEVSNRCTCAMITPELPAAPFCNSKMVNISHKYPYMQSSLTGNGARISVICTVTPASSQAEETHNTLKFATRAKKIEIAAQRNEIVDQASLIRRYQEEIQTLRSQLDVVARERGGHIPIPTVVHDPLHPEVCFSVRIQLHRTP